MSPDNSFVVINGDTLPEGPSYNTRVLSYIPLFSRITASLSLAQTITVDKLDMVANEYYHPDKKGIEKDYPYFAMLWKSINTNKQMAILDFLGTNKTNLLFAPAPPPKQPSLKRQRVVLKNGNPPRNKK